VPPAASPFHGEKNGNGVGRKFGIVVSVVEGVKLGVRSREFVVFSGQLLVVSNVNTFKI
jgi:hypothetical protein